MCYCPITNLDNADGAYEWTFGDKHFTEYGYNNNSAASNAMADSNVIKAMNPMNYIGVSGVSTAKYWRIRHGMNDRDTSLAIPALLALKLEDICAEGVFLLSLI